MLEVKDILVEAVKDALEKMAFLMIMPEEIDNSSPAESVISEIDFSGPSSGKIQIGSSLEFAKVFAENITADDDLDDQQCSASIEELCNVVSGLVLPMMSDSPTEAFDVTVPRRLNISWQEFISLEDTTILNVEDHALAVRMCVDH